jgi:hypothetical protein
MTTQKPHDEAIKSLSMVENISDMEAENAQLRKSELEAAEYAERCKDRVDKAEKDLEIERQKVEQATKTFNVIGSELWHFGGGRYLAPIETHVWDLGERLNASIERAERAENKIQRQKERIRILEGATNHAGGLHVDDECSKLAGANIQLKDEKNAAISHMREVEEDRDRWRSDFQALAIIEKEMRQTVDTQRLCISNSQYETQLQRDLYDAANARAESAEFSLAAARADTVRQVFEWLAAQTRDTECSVPTVILAAGTWAEEKWGKP